MAWFWADSNETASSAADSGAKCPVDHRKMAAAQPAACPMKPKGDAAVCPVKPKKEAPPVCPMKKTDGEDINPLNNMPHVISDLMMPGQKIKLPTERTFSTIPRGEDEQEGVWEYPSPQQMFNAMLRKGKAEDIPEDAVEDMVDVHNFLNEGAWQEILGWEKPHTAKYNKPPRLAQFTGRPDDMSPRALMYLQLSKVFPQSFNPEPPFDRHDWYVLRSNGQGGWDKVRYVIDYYGGPDDPHGMPTFFLDVRPALDNFTNAKDRFVHWSKPVWDKAMGVDSRD